MKHPRYMIDDADSAFFRYGLFRRVGRSLFGRTRWRYLRGFETIQEAKDFYEHIKSLPEYLD